jgi:hypothetical protein
MARKERSNVDYFPFLCKEGKAMFYIENKYGNDGFATWVKILRQLAVTNNHYLELSDKTELMFLSSKCKISEEKLVEIIIDLCKLGEFNQEIWEAKRVIWSDKFIENIQDAYKRRNNKCITFSDLCIQLKHKCIHNVNINNKNVYKSTHTILDNNILDNKIINNKINSFDFSFCNSNVLNSFMEWLSYREQIGKPYKIQMAVEKCYRDIWEKANKNTFDFIKIINHTISHQWENPVVPELIKAKKQSNL